MELYIVRHAIAADAERGQEDSERPLTEQGRERFVNAVRGMRRLDLTFERVMYSPWKRAHQTAKLLEPIVYGPRDATELLCQPPSEALLETLQSHASEGPLVLVGHQPWLGELIAWLMTGDAAQHELIDLKKGSLVWLSGEPSPGGMHLRAYLTPRVLRAIR